jgi:hypothetical protein
MSEIISITIDGKTYEKYKKAYETIQKNKVGIDFGACPAFSYSWTIYSKDEALEEMAKKYQFIEFKQNEYYKCELAKLKKIIENLKDPIGYLLSIGFNFTIPNPNGNSMEKDEVIYEIPTLIDKISKGKI